MGVATFLLVDGGTIIGSQANVTFTSFTGYIAHLYAEEQWKNKTKGSVLLFPLYTIVINT